MSKTLKEKAAHSIREALVRDDLDVLADECAFGLEMVCEMYEPPRSVLNDPGADLPEGVDVMFTEDGGVCVDWNAFEEGPDLGHYSGFGDFGTDIEAALDSVGEGILRLNVYVPEKMATQFAEYIIGELGR